MRLFMKLNLDQLYLDLCTSWQSEPQYPEDVKNILRNIEVYYKDEANQNSAHPEAQNDESRQMAAARYSNAV